MVFEGDIVALADGTLFEVFKNYNSFKLKRLDGENVIDIDPVAFSKIFSIKGSKFAMP